jgi:hypothetical protein
MLTQIINFLNINASGLTILAALVAGIYKFWEFVNVRKTESRQREFNNYHDLVERLVTDRKEVDGIPFIDVQIASVFELESFPRYYKPTKVILNRMRLKLLGKEPQKDLVKQIDETLSKIDKKWLQ